jgi:hypothetical protein
MLSKEGEMLKAIAWIAALGIASNCLLSGLAQKPRPLYGPHGLAPEAVRLGLAGNGYFHASIAALASAASARLRGAIRRDAAGGYHVHFADGPYETVLAEDVDYDRAHGYDRSEGDWVLVLMRGFAQHEVRKTLAAAVRKSTGLPSDARAAALGWLSQPGLLLVAYDRAIGAQVSFDGLIDKAPLKEALAAQFHSFGIADSEARALASLLDNRDVFFPLELAVMENGEVYGAWKSQGMGGIPVRVFEDFTGSAHALLVTDHEMAMDYLRRLHKDGMAMTCGSWSKPPSPEYATSNWWLNARAYSVMNYDEAAGTVNLREPSGTHPVPDGEFTLPVAKFLDAFESCAFSE